MQADTAGRWGLRIAGLAGFAIFLFFFVLTWRTPQWVETFARDYIEEQAQERLHAEIRAIAPAPGEGLQELAAAIYESNALRIDALKARLESRARDLFLIALDQVRDLDCKCRAAIEQRWTRMNAAQLASLVTDNQRVMSIIQGGYMVIVEELRSELRIFTATNAACFLLLLLVSCAKPAASRHLMIPGALLLVSTLFCAWMYAFQQNWLLTLVHGDYVGWAYASYLGVVFLFLCDIALNRGRVTCELANGIAGSLGGSLAALTPC
jgi:hypothetical protein